MPCHDHPSEKLPPRGICCAYLIRCGDGTLYGGWTVDLARRLEEHRRGKGARYTRGRGPLRLAYWEPCPSRGEALRTERRLKALSKEEKEALVKAFGLEEEEAP